MLKVNFIYSPVPAALHRESETHMKGGVSAERGSSGLEERDDEVAVSGCPGARLPMSLALRLHPRGASGATVRRGRRFSRTFQECSQ